MILNNFKDDDMGILTSLSQSIGQILELVANNTVELNSSELSSVAMLLELDSSIKLKIHKKLAEVEQ